MERDGEAILLGGGDGGATDFARVRRRASGESIGRRPRGGRGAKAFHAFLVAGTILLLLGLGWTWSAFHAEQTDTFTIPAGDGWHAVLEVNVPQGSRISGAFEVTSGGTVDVYLFDERQYTAYVSGRELRGIAAVSGDRIRFSFAVPEAGRYFLTVDHGAGQEAEAQDVRLDWRAVDLYPALLAVGLLALIVGIELVVGGVKVKGRSGSLPIRRAAPSTSPSAPSPDGRENGRDEGRP